ncbi:MAG: nucleotidase [Frankiales bacterium]|nr:nucleotidase [Frankiales bacterium]
MPTYEQFRLTVLGTTDTHGHILNWDYYTDSPYADTDGNHVGLAQVATVIAQLRDERRLEFGEAQAVLTLDAGDTIQGTPLSYLNATADGSAVHPIAAVMNAIGFDAAAIGNHEFNYGLDVFERFRTDADHPLLAANARDWTTGEPAFDEYVLIDVPAPGGRTVRIGVVGLVTPGCAIWDRAHLQGRVRFDGIVERAAEVIPRVRAAGADVVVVCCHSGADDSSSYGDALPWPENASGVLAREVPGIDAILVGHAHVEIAERTELNASTGRPVLLCEPHKWGMRVAVIDIQLAWHGTGWRVTSARSELRSITGVPADPRIVALIATEHERVRQYVNGVIGASTTAMSARTARWQDTAAIQLVNHVQGATVAAALAGTGYAELPIIALAAPFNSGAEIPAGPVTIRDVAGLYSYDNVLMAVQLSGAELLAYLEWSARYFRPSTDPAVDPATLIRARTDTAPAGMPDYNFDIAHGFAAPLRYDIDVSADLGHRIRNLTYDGQPVAGAQQFVVAVNNYRQSGGGNFPAVAQAKVVYDGGYAEIRQFIIDWVQARHSIDPTAFAAVYWRLVCGSVPLGSISPPARA